MLSISPKGLTVLLEFPLQRRKPFKLRANLHEKNEENPREMQPTVRVFFLRLCQMEESSGREISWQPDSIALLIQYQARVEGVVWTVCAALLPRWK